MAGRKQARYLAPTFLRKGVGASFLRRCGKFGTCAAFSCCVRDPNRRSLRAFAQKARRCSARIVSVRVAAKKPLSGRYSSVVGLGVPPFSERKLGTKVNPHHFTAGSTPSDCCPRKRHVWGTKAKPLAAYRRRLCHLSIPSSACAF
jgi:hypothetical protein